MTGHPRSRWIFLGLALLTAFVCVRLGLWQLKRYTTRSAANAAARTTRSLGFRPYPDSTSTLAPELGVVLRGSFDHEREYVLRGRAHGGTPGVEIATPFRLQGVDQAIVVIRGFVPAQDAMTIDLTALREPGERTIRGVLFPLPLAGTPIVRNGSTTWDAVPGAWIRIHSPYPVVPYALWQEEDSGMAALPIRVGAPALDDGPHLGYAIQWFAFAVIFGGGGFAYAFRKREERGENALP